VFFGYKTGFPTFQTGTITIPTNTSIGNYRIRMRAIGGNVNDIFACGLRQFGSTTDFTLSVIAPPSCLPVTNLSTSNITFTTADVSWDSQGTETSWIVEWGTPGFSPGTGAEIGSTTVSSTNVSLTGLTAETNYDVYVRADCENSDFSIWRSISIFSGYCMPSTYKTTLGYNTYVFSTTEALVNINYSTSSFPNQGYENASVTHTIIHSAGHSLDFSHSVSRLSYSNSLRIWIDWNNDFEFEDSEEVFFGYKTGFPTFQTGTIIIPANTPIGNYRMRIRSVNGNKTNISACGLQEYGSTIDFTLSVIATPSCLPVINLSTANINFTSADVSWDSQGTETSWDIEWGMPGFSPGTGAEIGSQTVSSQNASIVGLTSETNYDVYVRADCGSGDFSFWNSIYIFTGYCIPYGEERYTSVFYTTNAFANLDYSISEHPLGGYENLSATHIITQKASLSFDFYHNFSSTPSGGNTLKIWVDWNNDFVFDDTELVYLGHNNIGVSHFQIGTITIPVNIPIGNYRMRLRSTNLNKPNLPACGLQQYGSTLDFTLSVIAPPDCLPVTNISKTNISSTSINVSWDSQGTETSWDVEWGMQGFTPGIGNEIGSTNVSSTNVSINGLTAETNYDVYIRADCGNGNYSVWQSISFFFGYCIPTIYYSDRYTSAFSTTNAFSNINYSTSSFPNGGYENASASNTITCIADYSFNFSHTFYPNTNSNSLRIWVDWNNDFEFDDSEEVYLGYKSALDTFQTGTIDIPANIPLGNYLMRVRSIWGNSTGTNLPACGLQEYGSTVDFTLSIIDLPSCLPITNIDITTKTFTSANVSWTAGGTETSWIVEWGMPGFSPGTGAEIGSQTVTSPNVSITGLTAETNYDIYVRADCGSGDTSIWRSISIFSGYCQPNTYDNGRYTKFFYTTDALIDIDYSVSEQPAGGYENLSSTHIITQSVGQSFDFSHIFSVQTLVGDLLKIWVDWNNDLEFDDSEEVYLGYSPPPGTFQTGTITIPANTPIGNYRMRIRSTSGGFYFNLPACGIVNYGSTVDFTLSVIATPSCLPVKNISTSNITFNSADVSWDSQGTETSWNVEWGTPGFSPGTGSEIGSQTVTSPNVSINGLTSETNYNIYVRADCGNGDFSVWRSISFFSGYCVAKSTKSTSYTASFSTTEALTNVNYSVSSQPALGYQDASTTHVIIQNAGLSFDFSHNFSHISHNLRIWIDWDNNFEFESSEEVYFGYINSAPHIQTGTIHIPGNTPIGNYRMRLRSSIAYNSNLPACGIQEHGSTVDFTLSVIDPPSCFPVYSPKTTNYSANSVLLHWTSDGNLFDIEYGEVGFTQGNGTMLTEVSNNYILSGLTTGTQYDFYVRQNCGNGDESLWRGPVSFTPGIYDKKVPSMLNVDPQVTDVACGSVYSIEVPAGKQIESLKVEYSMTSVNPRLISEQRSVLYSPTLNTGETVVISGSSSDDFPGVQHYSRFVDFANGATGTVEFELKAWRTDGNPNCTDDEIFVAPYTWILTPTFEDVPACPNPPTDLGYNLISESSVELFWTEGEANATHQLKYGNVGFDVDTAGTTENNLTTNSLMLNNLDPFEAQEFYVRRDCGAGDFSDWVGPHRFNSGYCLPYSNFVYYFTAFSTTNAIENVTYSNSTASATGYVNNTSMIIEQLTGESFDFSANYIGGASGLRIWIDWNNDLVFDDSEQVFYLGNNSGNKSGTIDIPTNTPIGDYRMRVRVEQNANSIPSACGVIGFGEAMDFVLRVACPTIAPPTGETSQNFTAGQTIADLVVNGTNLVWYSDLALTSTLPTTTELVHNTTYYVVSESGNCKSSALEVTAIDCSQVVSTPTGEENQEFTNGQTIDDLIVSGNNLVWYSDENLTSTIPTTTELVHNTTYYVVSESGNCKSSALEVTAIDCSQVVSTPTGETSQNFTAGQTIADLVVDGTDLVFYNSTYSETFSLTDELVDNQTYYVVSEIGNCMSDPLIITVTMVVSRTNFDIYGFSYHPNPVNDMLHFSANLPIQKIVISNILGQQINANLNSDNTTLDMSNLPNGNYFVKVTIEGVSKTIKIVKN